jgi:internalin A
MTWGGWTNWPRARGADAVRGALSLSAAGRDLSGLSSLAPDQLWLLDARDRPITDDDLRHLRPFYRLEVLALDGTRITDRGLEIVRNFPELRVISLTGCGLSDDSARILGSVKTLQDVELDETAVSDEGVYAFEGHPELTVLDLRKTKVTGDGLSYLVDLPKLRELRLAARAERKARRLFRHRPEVLIL